MASPFRPVDAPAGAKVGAAAIDAATPDVPVDAKERVELEPPPAPSGYQAPADTGLPAVGRGTRRRPRRTLRQTVEWAAGLGGRALALAGVLCAMSCASTSPRTAPRASAAPPPPSRLSQLDHPDDPLGRGGYRTIAEAGCLLSAMAMASESLTDAKWTPKTANDHVLKANGFSGAALEVPRAARALGLKVDWRSGLSADDTADAHARLRRHLEAGHAAVACVDLGPGSSSGRSEGDHFVFLYSADARGRVFGVDPAGGYPIVLESSGEGGFLRYGADSSRRVCELMLVSPR